MYLHPFLDELEGLPVLGDLEQLHGVQFTYHLEQHCRPLDDVPQVRGVPDEAPEVTAVCWLAHVLGQLVPLIHGHGIAQNRGWTCTAALGAR